MTNSTKWTSSSDPGIKLFGKTITASILVKNQSLENGQVRDRAEDEEDGEIEELGSSAGSNSSCENEEKQRNVVVPESQEGSAKNKQSNSNRDENSAAEEVEVDDQATKDDGNNGNGGSNKPKKPDKPVACPRCDSMDTKFCYYNNYNVNQPRHFCKSCQRYWTSGGTLRNVPVGAGRRKNKHSHSHSHPTGILNSPSWNHQHHHHHQLKHDHHHHHHHHEGSMITTAVHGHQQQSAELQFLHRHPQHSGNSDVTSTSHSQMSSFPSGAPSVTSMVKRDDPAATAAAAAAVAAAAAAAYQEPMAAAAAAAAVAALGWPHPPPPPLPPALAAAAGQWSMQWAAVAAVAAAAANSGGGAKRGRVESSLEGRESSSASGGYVWMPKTLRIDDPGEAARSSIWAALGMERANGTSAGHQLMIGGNKQDHGKLLQHLQMQEGTRSNPAALARSAFFQESN